jgi:hypothetical protein
VHARVTKARGLSLEQMHVINNVTVFAIHPRNTQPLCMSLSTANAPACMDSCGSQLAAAGNLSALSEPSPGQVYDLNSIYQVHSGVPVAFAKACYIRLTLASTNSTRGGASS